MASVSGKGDFPLLALNATDSALHRRMALFGIRDSSSDLNRDHFFTVSVGGSLYTENLSETASLSEAIANALSTFPSVSESLTLADGVGTLATFSPGVSESVALAENLSESLVRIYAEALAEVILLSESLSGDKVRNTYMLPRLTTRWRMP